MTPKEKWLHRAANVVLGLALAFVLFVQNPGEESKTALCAFKHDLEVRHANSKRYLQMSKEERIEEFGPQLGSIPERTIIASRNNQAVTLSSLDNLNC